ncbi:hypothetical protein [Saccharopolyspora sp. ASAGF58]|uniref:hypothetical protein n=1 Tax=Saccharopolyspora sp. ASAGF58 TaxID=2719023 RepID=UPI001440301E|nr:hypothetical protein [Saccharopolyspora sp. ASAGF58]QIZ38020.1 hypothetical protein FDZ84_29930 [Saccharopolyspora sp. ASAGF58]
MSELFNGRWRIDAARSLVWDDATKEHVPDLVGDEIITLRVDRGVQDYEVLYGDSPVIRMGYTSRYDDPTWVPYLVRSIENTAERTDEEAVAEFKARIHAAQGERERHFVVGKPYGLVRTVYVDERSHYRVSKDPNTNRAQSVMLRRMAEDGDLYVSTVMDLDGVPFRIRTFVRDR